MQNNILFHKASIGQWLYSNTSFDWRRERNRNETFMMIMKKLVLTNKFCFQNNLIVILNLVDGENCDVFYVNL